MNNIRGRLSLPYAHLNLRFNPFGELGRKERAEIAVGDVEKLARRIKQPGFAVQFMGHPGSGKTSHMLAIYRRFPDAPFVHVHENERLRLPDGHPLFIDDFHFIPQRRRKRILRRNVSLIFTTHEDLSGELEKAGFETKTVYPENIINEDHLHSIFDRRIEKARRGPGPLPRVSISAIRKLIETFGSDVRSMEFLLYDIFQSMKEVRDVSL